MKWSEAGIEQKFGVKPSSIPDYLALVGDSADGYPGLPGFGAKSAALLLSTYGSLDAIPDDEAEWTARPRGAARLAKTLREQREQARLYRQLATLRRDVPLGVTVDDLEWPGPDRDRLRELSREIADPGLLQRVDEVMRQRA